MNPLPGPIPLVVGQPGPMGPAGPQGSVGEYVSRLREIAVSLCVYCLVALPACL